MHICLPDFNEVKLANNERVVFYNLHINGLIHCKLRYKQLLHLHNSLQQHFSASSTIKHLTKLTTATVVSSNTAAGASNAAAANTQINTSGLNNGNHTPLPRFPCKKLFPLTQNQLEARRQQLEKYLQIIAQDKAISSSYLFNAFLTEAQRESAAFSNISTQLDVELVNGDKIRMPIQTHDSLDSVLNNVCQALGLRQECWPYFCLCLCGYDVVSDKLIVKRQFAHFEAPYITLQTANQQQQLIQQALKKKQEQYEANQQQQQQTLLTMQTPTTTITNCNCHFCLTLSSTSNKYINSNKNNSSSSSNSSSSTNSTSTSTSTSSNDSANNNQRSRHFNSSASVSSVGGNCGFHDTANDSFVDIDVDKFSRDQNRNNQSIPTHDDTNVHDACNLLTISTDDKRPTSTCSIRINNQQQAANKDCLRQSATAQCGDKRRACNQLDRCCSSSSSHLIRHQNTSDFADNTSDSDCINNTCSSTSSSSCLILASRIATLQNYLQQQQDNEMPHRRKPRNTFVMHRILLRKSYWDPLYDTYILDDQQAINLLFIQTYYDVKRNLMFVDETTLSRLNKLFLANKKHEYILLARTLKYYNYVHFEPCYSDFPRPNSKVLISIGSREINMRVLKHIDEYEQEKSAAAAAAAASQSNVNNSSVATRAGNFTSAQLSSLGSILSATSSSSCFAASSSSANSSSACSSLSPIDSLVALTVENSNSLMANNSRQLGGVCYPSSSSSSQTPATQQQKQQHSIAPSQKDIANLFSYNCHDEYVVVEEYNFKVPLIKCWRLTSIETLNTANTNRASASTDSARGNLSNRPQQQRRALSSRLSYEQIARFFSPRCNNTRSFSVDIDANFGYATTNHNQQQPCLRCSQVNDDTRTRHQKQTFRSESSQTLNSGNEPGPKLERASTSKFGNTKTCNNNKKPVRAFSFNNQLNQGVQGFTYELSFEYLVSKDSLKWITILSDQAIFISISLQGVVDELVSKRYAGLQPLNGFPLLNSSNLSVADKKSLSTLPTYMKRDGTERVLRLNKSLPINRQSACASQSLCSPSPQQHSRRPTMTPSTAGAASVQHQLRQLRSNISLNLSMKDNNSSIFNDAFEEEFNDEDF